MLLGDGDPPDSCKCKKVSGTKMAEQKWQNKNYSLFRVSQTKIGGDSASAKRSAEQKLVGGTKKRSAEQKLVSGTKTAEQKLVGRTKKRSAEQKLVSRTKMVEQKWWNKNYSLFQVTQTKIGGDSASAKRSTEQKLVGTVSHWVTGTPSASANRSVEQKQWNKNWWGLLAIG